MARPGRLAKPRRRLAAFLCAVVTHTMIGAAADGDHCPSTAATTIPFFVPRVIGSLAATSGGAPRFVPAPLNETAAAALASAWLGGWWQTAAGRARVGDALRAALRAHRPAQLRHFLSERAAKALYAEVFPPLAMARTCASPSPPNETL